MRFPITAPILIDYFCNLSKVFTSKMIPRTEYVIELRHHPWFTRVLNNLLVFVRTRVPIRNILGPFPPDAAWPTEFFQQFVFCSNSNICSFLCLHCDCFCAHLSQEPRNTYAFQNLSTCSSNCSVLYPSYNCTSWLILPLLFLLKYVNWQLCLLNFDVAFLPILSLCFGPPLLLSPSLFTAIVNFACILILKLCKQ